MSSPENRFQKIQKEEKEGEGCASEHSRSDVRLVWSYQTMSMHPGDLSQAAMSAFQAFRTFRFSPGGVGEHPGRAAPR